MGHIGKKPNLSDGLLFIGQAGELAALAALRDELAARGLAAGTLAARESAGGLAGALAAPFSLAAAAFRLAGKKRQGAGRLVLACPGQYARYRAAAKLLKLELWRLVLPGSDLASPANRRDIETLRKPGGRAIVLCRRQEERLLSFGLRPDSAAYVPFGIRQRDKARQDTIFSQLAASQEARGYKKFFSVGAVSLLNESRPIETLFQAVAQSRSVVANLQLILIGDGREKKNLSWLAKKLGLGDLVWFVGEQAKLGKWLENLDAYVVPGNGRAAPELAACLRAAALARPLVVPEASAYDAIFRPGQEALAVAPGKAEDLAQAIIRLRQDKRLAGDLGKAAKKKVEEEHTVERMADEFLEILKK
jgi:glycosyltransferase involved in cell wall biosynthesis